MNAIISFAAACVATGGDGWRLITDRPDFTESVEAVPSGRVQVEGGITYAREGDEDAATVPELLARIGIMPRAELRLTLPSAERSETD
jgi:hypothetical protein